MQNILEHVRKQLQIHSDEKTRLSSQKFSKEKITSYGVKTAAVNNISKETFMLLKTFNKSDIWKMCDDLWRSGILEESIVACRWSYYIHKRYEPSDFKIFEKWIDNYVNNWASCDTLCNHTVGEFVEMYPDYLSNLKKFTTSKNRWMRRAAAVSLIVPAREGKFLNDIFEIADKLLVDEDDLVQKGYGWMLKVASKMYQKEVFEYVQKNKNVMPRTALRYAIEKMPEEYLAAAMK